MVSVDGFVGVKASCVLRRVAEVLLWKWGKSYGQVMDWVRSSLSLAVIRATGLDRECHGGAGEALRMVLMCPCAALIEGLVSLCIDCVCENCVDCECILK